MDGVPVEHIGTRIRRWRRRRNGMSQAALAGLSGLSQSYISQIESGRLPLDRKSTQVAIASALNISVAQLLGQRGEPGDPIKDQAVAHVPAIRAALIELGVGETRKPRRDADTVRATVHQVTGMRNAADYAAAAPLLPDLLHDLGGHNGTLAPEMVETLLNTRRTLQSVGFPDLGREAAELGVRIAEEYGEPAWRGVATLSRVQALPPESATLGRRVAELVADEMQATQSTEAQEVYGNLHLIAGLEAAVAGRAEDAWAHIDEAADVARSLGEPDRQGAATAGVCGLWFGPTNVDCWRVAVAAELGDVGAALSADQRIQPDAIPVPGRWVFYHTDMARILATEGRDRDAMYALARAERSGPQHFRFNPVARNLVHTLIERAKRRAVDEQLLHLARVLGIHPV